MKYIWLKTISKEERAAIGELKDACLAHDLRLPLLNLPEKPEKCDGCLAAVDERDRFAGILTCLYGENTVEVCVLVHPDRRGEGTGTELLHRLMLSTKKVPVFPVAADDESAAAFLTYIGRREICRELLLAVTGKTYRDADPCIPSGAGKRLRVACKTGADGQFRYTLYFGAVPAGRCLVTEGCVSDVWVRGAFRGRGFGSFLLRTVIRHQFHLGKRRMFLHVTNLNRAACALYQKYGFEVTEEVVYWA